MHKSIGEENEDKIFSELAKSLVTRKTHVNFFHKLKATWTSIDIECMKVREIIL